MTPTSLSLRVCITASVLIALAAFPCGVVPAGWLAAHAQPPRTPEEEARALIDLARMQLDLACADCSPSRALDLARQSHQLHPSALAIQYIAIAEKRLSRYLEAEQHLLEALAFTDEPPLSEAERSAALRTIEDVRQHLVDLVVECPLAGAEVFVNDRPRGRLDSDGRFQVRLQRGVYDVRVVLEGQPTLHRRGVDAQQPLVRVEMTVSTDAVTAPLDAEALRASLDRDVQERIERERRDQQELAEQRDYQARRAAYEVERDHALAENRDMMHRRRRGWIFASTGVLLVGVGGARLVTSDTGVADELSFSTTRNMSSLILMSAGLTIWLVSFPVAVRARAVPLPDAPPSRPQAEVRCGVLSATFVGCGGNF